MVYITHDTDEFLSILQHADYSENAYLSYDYYRVYLKYFPPSNLTCFYVKDDEGKVIGLLPLTKNRACYDIVGYRASNYMGYICDKKNVERIDAEISLYITQHHSGMVINFYDVNTAAPLYPILDKQKWTSKVYLYDCPFVDVAQPFETLFLTQVTKSKKRAELKKFSNKLDNVGKVELINIDDEKSWKQYGYLIKNIYPLHKARFSDVYIPSELCLYKNENYYTELFESLVTKEKALLSLLTVDGVVVSFLYTVVSDGIVMDWMPAFDPAFAKYSLGTVHLMKMLEYLCKQDKYRILDFSKGAAVYKERWAKGKTDNYMFVRRYSCSPVSLLQSWRITQPIKLKNYLRKKGVLDKIKDMLVIIQRNKETVSARQDGQYRIVEELPEDAHIIPATYDQISQTPFDIRQDILTAIYMGNCIEMGAKDNVTYCRINTIE